jgi:site-specific recombinase XerD
MPRTHSTRTLVSAASLAKLYQGFLQSLRHKRPETRATYERALREFLRWYPGKTPFTFKVADVERYKHHLTVRKNLSPVSVSTYLTALRRFCAYLMHAHVIRENPADAVGGNRRPQAHTRDHLTAYELDAVLSSVQRTDERGMRDYAFLQLMAGCALSEIEIVRANVCDVTIESESAILQVQGKGCTKKDQTVTLPDAAREALQRYLAIRAPAKSSDPLFTSAGNRTRGRRMTTRGVRDRICMYLEEAGLRQQGGRRITPYSLRHTAAVLMADKGATADEIRVRLRLGSNATAMLYINSAHKNSDQERHHGE